MLKVLALSFLFAAALSFPLQSGSTYYSDESAEHLFNAFVEQHGKTYSEQEAHNRFQIFRANLEKIRAHNDAAANGEHTYFLGLTPFADWSKDEFKTLLGFRGARSASNVTVLPAANEDSVDWRAKGAVTPVKNQGQCGSCWAFSTTGSVEGLNFLKTGKLVALSEQELLDCDTAQDQGCNGGLMDNAFTWIASNGGIDSEDDYKYLARRSFFFRCPAEKKNKHVAVITGHTDVEANSESQLAAAVAQQPVSVAIEADELQLYSHGIFSGTCGTNLDHGVLAVGYGTENGQDYWLVKNSWGASWGEQGYFRLSRNVAQKGGQCGIAMAASYPTA